MAGCGGWQSVNPLCRAGEVLGSAGKSLTNDVFGSIADYFAGVANSMVSWLWKQLNTATSVDLTAQWIKTDLIATGAIAALVAFALFLIQIIASVIRQDGGGLGRAVRGLGVAFIGAAFAIVATQILLAAVDELANGVVKFALGTDLSGLGPKLVATSTLANIGNPAGLLLMSLVLIVSVVVIWVALMFRKLLIVISAVFAPIAFSGAAADISKSWVRRWIEFTVALVVSKLVLVLIFMIGLSVLNGANQSGGGTTGGGSGHHPATTAAMTNLSVGALTLLLAGFAPWIAIKMVHFAGDSFHAVHTHAGLAASGAQRMTAAPQKVASNTRSVASTMSANGSSSKSSTSAAAYPSAQGKPAGAASSAGAATAAPAAAATGGAALVAAAPAAAKGAADKTGRAAEMASPPKSK